FLQDVRTLCRDQNVLMVADGIQSGLARTGRTFACDHEDVVPDIYIPGKALGGGLYPVSAVAADRDVLGVITPGTHGSTFGGNPPAAALGREVVTMLETGEFQERAAKLGEQLYVGLSDLVGFGIDAVRARGLWAGIDIATDKMTGPDFPEALLAKGSLAKGCPRPARPRPPADRGLGVRHRPARLVVPGRHHHVVELALVARPAHRK